jgi:hypothetical protein
VPLSIILGIIATIYGLFTANWDFLGGGILIIIIFPLLATLAVIVGSFAMWLGLLFQPCTPAYAIIWFILGIPFAIIGASIGLAPTYTGVVTVMGERIPFSIKIFK